MEIWEIDTPKVKELSNGGYVSIHDDGSELERKLIIIDDKGNMVTLLNEQIGELYRRIKPSLAG